MTEAMLESVLLEASALQVGHGGRALLPPCSFAIAREQLWAIVGQNGAGKTTLLRTLLGLLPRVGGRVDRAAGARVGYVPQRAELELTAPRRVADVVAEGLDSGWSFLWPGIVRAARRRIAAVLEEVGMAHLERQPFAALSDGQRQRVLLARALIHDPALLVLDEPTSAMDIAAEQAAFSLFARLQASRRLGLLIVSHHMHLLAERATHVVWVDKDEGRFLAGTLEAVKADPGFRSHYGPIFFERRRETA